MRRTEFLLTTVVSLVIFAALSGFGGEAMTYIYNGPESSQDIRYLHHWKYFARRWKRPRTNTGPIECMASEFMTERRQAFELKKGSGKLTVMYLSTAPDFEKNLTGDPYPGGQEPWRLLCFSDPHEQRGEISGTVQILDDLRKFSYGLGLGWIDVDILKSNRFTVVTGSSYEGPVRDDSGGEI